VLQQTYLNFGGLIWDFLKLWESSPRLRATRDAVDSIVNFCDRAEIAINEATIKIMEMTENVLNG
jgi:hypothetical protein